MSNSEQTPAPGRELRRSMSSIERRAEQLKDIDDRMLHGANLEGPLMNKQSAPDLMRSRSMQTMPARGDIIASIASPKRDLFRSRSMCTTHLKGAGCLEFEGISLTSSDIAVACASVLEEPETEELEQSAVCEGVVQVRQALSRLSTITRAGDPQAHVMEVEAVTTAHAAAARFTDHNQNADVGDDGAETFKKQQQEDEEEDKGEEDGGQEVPTRANKRQPSVGSRSNPWAPLPGPGAAPLQQAQLRVVQEAERSLRTLDSFKVLAAR